MNSAPASLVIVATAFDLLEAAEEIRMLHDDAGGLVVQMLLQVVRIEEAVAASGASRPAGRGW